MTCLPRVIMWVKHYPYKTALLEMRQCVLRSKLTADFCDFRQELARMAGADSITNHECYDVKFDDGTHAYYQFSDDYIAISMSFRPGEWPQ